MKNKSIALGITDREMNLIGFKGDTFWSISKFPKIHPMNAGGQIDTHLIPNLLNLLNKSESILDKDDRKIYVPEEQWLGHKELFIVAYECPSEGDGFVYPKELMKVWVNNLPEPTVLYRLHRIDWNMNGIDKPWIADVDLTPEIETIDKSISLN